MNPLARNYPLLLLAQTLVYFGDSAVLMIILGPLTFQQKDGLIGAGELSSANAIYTSMLFVPFVVLAPFTGYLNDRFAKTRWLLWGTIIKICGTTLAALSLAAGHNWQALGYFIVGIGACVYSPAKYGILPEILPEERLVKANGTLEMLTLIAILFGNLAGARIIDTVPPVTCFLLLSVVYAGAMLVTLAMKATSGNPSVRWQSSVPAFFDNFRSAMKAPRLSRVLLGTALFWLLCAVIKMNLQPWGLETLGLGLKTENTNTAIALIGLWLSIGVMAGSVCAGQIHRVGDLRGTRPYGWLLAFSMALVAVFNASTPHALILAAMVGSGFVAGLFLIPLNAALQSESDPAKLGKTVATQNFLENLAMSLGCGAVLLAAHSGARPPHIFIGLGLFVAVSVIGLKMPRSRSAVSPDPTPLTALDRTP